MISLGNGEKKQADDHREKDQSLDRVWPIEWIDLILQCILGGQRGLQRFAREHPDDSVSGGHGKNNRTLLQSR